MEGSKGAVLDGLDEEVGVGGDGGGCSELVQAGLDLAALGCCVEHLLHAAAAGVVQPRGAHDDVLVHGVAHHGLAGALGLAVRGVRVGVVELVDGLLELRGVDVVRRDLHHDGAAAVGRQGHVART